MGMTAVGATSRWVAASRALETESDQPLFADPFARELAGDVGFAMRAAVTVQGYSPEQKPGQYLSIRTKFFDDAVTDAVKTLSIDQVILLAAGMDTRAFRLDWPDGITLFEIDREDVIEEKERILRRLGAQPRCNRRLVSADLTAPWISALLGAGFNRERPVAVVAEGLLCYLDAGAVAALLGQLREVTSVGSWCGVDVLGQEVLVSPIMRGYLARLRELGCAWTFGVSDPDAFMEEWGWRAHSIMAGEPEANYGRWPFPLFSRGVPDLPRIYLVRAHRTAD